jgi:hypothetical protein
VEGGVEPRCRSWTSVYESGGRAGVGGFAMRGFGNGLRTSMDLVDVLLEGEKDDVGVDVVLVEGVVC